MSSTTPRDARLVDRLLRQAAELRTTGPAAGRQPRPGANTSCIPVRHGDPADFRRRHGAAGAPVPLSARTAISSSCRPARSSRARTPLATARRELQEETRLRGGGVARSSRRCIPASATPTRRIELLPRARARRTKGAPLDEGEFLEVLRLPLAEALEWVRRGRITRGENHSRPALGREDASGEAW